MKYLKVEMFKGYKEEPINLIELGIGTDSKFILTSEIINLVLSSYQPSRDFSLNMSQLNILLNVLNTLNGTLDVDGYMSFEDEPWRVILQTLENMCTLLLGKLTLQGPFIYRLWKDMPDKKSF